MAFWNRRRDEQRALPRENVMPMLLSSAPGGSVTPTTATMVADAYACIRALSDAAASIPLIPYRRTQNGRERLEGGRLVDLLQRPAPASTQANLVGQIVAHLNLYGNAYLGKYRHGDQIAELGLLAPDRVMPEVRNGRPLYTYTPTLGEQVALSTDDVVHIKALTTDGLLGLSPVRQARVVLGLSDQLAQHAATFFENDARPAGVLRIQGQVGDMLGEFEQAWNARHQGTANAHKIAIVTGGEVDFTALTMPFDDAQFLEQRKLSAVEVARIFRVPPWMIGADSGESMTYSNTEQQALQFVTYSLRPWLVAIEQAITNDPDLCSQRQYAEFLLDSLLRADSKTRAEVYTMALNPTTGWMNREEVRQRENLEHEDVHVAEARKAGNVLTQILAEGAAAKTQNGNGAAVLTR